MRERLRFVTLSRNCNLKRSDMGLQALHVGLDGGKTPFKDSDLLLELARLVASAVGLQPAERLSDWTPPLQDGAQNRDDTRERGEIGEEVLHHPYRLQEMPL